MACSGSFLLVQMTHIFCSAALCPDPGDLENGMVTFTGNSIGDTATYTCNSGFELVGNATVTCTQVDENSVAYPSVLSVCRREYCMNITRACSLVVRLSYENVPICIDTTDMYR